MKNHDYYSLILSVILAKNSGWHVHCDQHEWSLRMLSNLLQDLISTQNLVNLGWMQFLAQISLDAVFMLISKDGRPRAHAGFTPMCTWSAGLSAWLGRRQLCWPVKWSMPLWSMYVKGKLGLSTLNHSNSRQWKTWQNISLQKWCLIQMINISMWALLKLSIPPPPTPRLLLYMTGLVWEDKYYPVCYM